MLINSFVTAIDLAALSRETVLVDPRQPLLWTLKSPKTMTTDVGV